MSEDQVVQNRVPGHAVAQPRVEFGVFDLSRLPIVWSNYSQSEINGLLRSFEKTAEKQAKQLDELYHKPLPAKRYVGAKRCKAVLPKHDLEAANPWSDPPKIIAKCKT